MLTVGRFISTLDESKVIRFEIGGGLVYLGTVDKVGDDIKQCLIRSYTYNTRLSRYDIIGEEKQCIFV